MKAARCEIFLYDILYFAKIWYIRQEKQDGYELV